MPADSIVTVIKDTVFIKDTIYRTEIITVYKDTIQKTELVELYQNVLQNQSSNFSTLINVLLGIMVVLLGGTWLWNLFVTKKQIRKEIERINSESKEEVNSLNIKFDKLEKKLIDDLEAEKQKNQARLNQLEDNVINDSIYSRGELCRIMAAYNEDARSYFDSISWWCEAIECFSKISDETLLRFCVDRLLQVIKIDGWAKGDKGDFNIETVIKRIETYVPPLLSAEKNEILTAFKSIK